MAHLVNLGLDDVFGSSPSPIPRALATLNWKEHPDGCDFAVLEDDGTKLVALVRGPDSGGERAKLPHQIDERDLSDGYRVAIILRGIVIPPQEFVDRDFRVAERVARLLREHPEEAAKHGITQVPKVETDRKMEEMHAAGILPGELFDYVLSARTLVLLVYLGKKRKKDRKGIMHVNLGQYVTLPFVRSPEELGPTAAYLDEQPGDEDRDPEWPMVDDLTRPAHAMIAPKKATTFALTRVPPMSRAQTEKYGNGGMMCIILNNGGKILVDDVPYGPGSLLVSGAHSSVEAKGLEPVWCLDFYADQLPGEPDEPLPDDDDEA